MQEGANSFGRGPLGVPTNSPVSDPGTSARIQNRPHRPVGTTNPVDAGASLFATQKQKRRKSPEPLPQLQYGSRGENVQRLQHLLNSRTDGRSHLKVDGIFGPMTRGAVIDFQKKSDLRPDGVVGPKMWFVLISTEPLVGATPPGLASRTGPQPKLSRLPEQSHAAPVPRTDDDNIEAWSLGQRFEFVLTNTPSHLKGNLQTQFKALLTPDGIASMVGCLVVWGACQFIGIGEILDGILLLWAGFSAGRHLGSFVAGTCMASKKSELVEAASDLAIAVEIIGVMAFFGLLSRVARFLRGKVRGTEEGGPPSQEDAPPESKGDGAKSASSKSSEAEVEKPATKPTATKSPFSSSGKPKASEIEAWAKEQGWTRSQTENGPIKYTDENGVVRATIKKGSPRAPGSGDPHVELRNADGQRVNPQGTPVTRKSIDNHTPIEWDL